jgi:hypothetical protein
VLWRAPPELGNRLAIAQTPDARDLLNRGGRARRFELV